MIFRRKQKQQQTKQAQADNLDTSYSSNNSSNKSNKSNSNLKTQPHHEKHNSPTSVLDEAVMKAAASTPPDLVSELTGRMEVINIPGNNNNNNNANGAGVTHSGSSANSNISNNSSRRTVLGYNQPVQQVQQTNTNVSMATTLNGFSTPIVQQQQQRIVTAPMTPLTDPKLQPSRPWDAWVAAGPPADPIEFPRPRIHRGKRVDVACYIPSMGKHQVLKVLMRTDAPSKMQQRAYYPIPGKPPIKTIMGRVEICLVLKRNLNNSSNSSDDSMSDDDSENGNYEDDDIVFELTNEYVAVKVNFADRMEKLRGQHAEDPLKEISAMQWIGNDHPNVLGCIDVLFDGSNLNIVMPYCNKGDLFELLQESQNCDPPGLSEAQARYWFRQVVAGMDHLHKRGVCHRDLSPENVMIDSNQSVIIDLGMCLRVPYSSATTPNAVADITHGTQKRLLRPQGACGKLPYMSPEIYRNKYAFDGAAADVWTAGTILFCMLTGNRSYQRPHRSDPQFYWMAYGLPQLLSDWSVTLTPEGLHLLQNMLQVDPRLRLTVDEILRHPWFTGSDDPTLPPTFASSSFM